MSTTSGKSPTPATVDATPEETAAFRSAQEAEYGTWVAAVPIAFNGSPAYNPGDPVPASNVEKYGYDHDGSVVKISSAAGKNVIAEVHAAATAGQTVTEVPSPVSLNVPVQ